MRTRANGCVDGRTALMLACFEGNLALARRLLAAGADVNARDRDGDTALMFAAFRGHAALVRLLLEHGADIHAQARNGWTAEKAARSGPHLDVVEIIRRSEARRAELIG
jgi:ankyrin repeat protein